MKKFLIKAFISLFSFILVFLFLQNILLPKHMKASTLAVEGYSKLKNNTLDVLFLGASQMFCSVDSQRLTEKYEINSYDLGASSQMLLSSKYYLEYALKTQKPKLVVLEMSSAFFDENYLTDQVISWSYAPMPLDKLKWNSLMELFNGDKTRVIKNTYLTFFQYHNRWNSLGPQDIMYYFGKRDYSHRGFLALDGCEKVIFGTDLELNDKQLPDISVVALNSIVEICSQNDIKLLLFKVPVPGWGAKDSKTIREYADANEIRFFDMNELIEQIGIDGETDYANISHVNKNGAEKITNYLGEYLKQYFLKDFDK